MKEIIVIVGPTGVGKTKLSIELAKRLNGEIINGDSVSIYKHLDIGSAKPTKDEQKEAIHHLIDIKELNEEYSVYDYQKDARAKIKEISSKGKRIILVGGTGLYIKAALYQYEFTKGTTYHTYDELSNEEILKKIKQADHHIDIHPNNRKRLVRMLNKIENKEKMTNHKDRALYPVKVIGLTTDREILYKRIDRRVEDMMRDGLLEEVKSLKEEYPHSKILNHAIGYKEFYDYLFSNKILDLVKEEIKTNCRHYAKRQYTFFRHQMDVKWFETNYKNFNDTIDKVIAYID